MKLQLDTENKTIKLQSTVKLKDLIKTLNALFPNKEWKDYILETNTSIVGWSNPIYIERPYYQPYYTQPWITYSNKISNLMASMPKGTEMKALGSTQTNYKINSGIYNVDIKA